MSLSIGIFAGIIINNNDILNEEQKKIIERLELDFKQLRQDNITLNTQLVELKNRQKLDQKLMNSIIPILVKDRIKNERIIILEVEQDERCHELIDVLKLAGAEIIEIVSINKDLFVNDGILKAMMSNTLPVTPDLDCVIVVGGCQNIRTYNINTLYSEIIDAFINNKIKVIDVEKTFTVIPDNNYFKEKNIPIISNIDTLIGQVALILSIEGRPH